MALGLFRKRKKEILADGTKKVTVTDRKGVVRKQKLVKPGGIKEKQKYGRDGNIKTRKLKGPNMKKFKLDVKGGRIVDTPGYKWADNPNKKKSTKKTTNTVKKTDTKPSTKVVLNDGKKTDTTKKTTTTNNTNKKTTTTNTNKTTTKKSQTFKEAFRENRNAGKKEFTWNNKKYHTRTKEEEAKRIADAQKKTSENNKKKQTNTNTSTNVDKSTKSDDHIEDIEIQNQTTKKTNTNKKPASNKKDNQEVFKNKKTHTKNHVPIIMGPKFKKGGHVKGIGRWAGKNVPGMRYD